MESLAEQIVNLFFKFWVAASFWKWVVIPMEHAEWIDFVNPLPITVMFTVLSLIQGYFWRRIFNKINLHELIHRFVTRIKKPQHI